MLELLRLLVLTPVAALLDVASVRWVQVRLADGGGLGIFPGHAPLLAETVAALLRYADADGEHVLELDAGILQISPSGVTLFTSGARDEAPLSGTAEVESGSHFERLARELRAANLAERKKKGGLLLAPCEAEEC